MSQTTKVAHRTVKVRDLDVFYREAGPKDAPAVLLLHGFPTSSQMFRNLMFMRVMPNLRRIGLLTDSVRPLFEKLGMLEYENLRDDGDIDWAELSRPLFSAPKTPTVGPSVF